MIAPDDPRHGKYAGYVAGCKCDPCFLANRRYDKLVTLRRMRGPLTVPIDRAAEHVARCAELGMPYAVFEAAGVRDAGRIHRRKHPVIHAATERRVLSVVPTPGVNWFPNHGAIRRLRALLAIGHPQHVLATKVGVPEQHMSTLVSQHRAYNVKPDLWKRIAAVYEELSMRPGDSNRSRTRAKKNGWAPPLAYDEGEIDDPNAKPVVGAVHVRKSDVDEAVVLRLLAGERLPCTTEERHETMRRWKAWGRAEAELCGIQGWKSARYGRSEVA